MVYGGHYERQAERWKREETLERWAAIGAIVVAAVACGWVVLCALGAV